APLARDRAPDREPPRVPGPDQGDRDSREPRSRRRRQQARRSPCTRRCRRAARRRLTGAMSEPIEVRRLEGDRLTDALDGLARVLADCVAGGASVSYMWPFTHDDARAAFEGFAADAARGNRIILAAFDDDTVVGTVQVLLALPPNQPHRGEIAKLLVHRDARRRGVAQLLMQHAEAEARAEGKG